MSNYFEHNERKEAPQVKRSHSAESDIIRAPMVHPDDFTARRIRRAAFTAKTGIVVEGDEE